MIRIFLMVVYFFPSFAISDEQLLYDIAELKWENRVLLICSEDKQENSLEELSYEIDDRDLLWFLLSIASVASNYKGEISAEFLITTNTKYCEPEVSVILIGKDGGIKNSYALLDMRSVFESIDAMPMRQSEVRDRKLIQV